MIHVPVSRFSFVLLFPLWAGLFHIHPLPAQTTDQNKQASPNKRSDLIKTNAAVLLNPFDDRYEGIKGSPFVFEGWKAGTVTIRDDEQSIPFEGISLDAHNKVVWVRTENIPPGVIEMENISRVEIHSDGESQIFLIYPSGRIEGSRKDDLKVYELLYKGEITLLKEHGKKFYKASYQGAYSSDRRSDEYKDVNRWFLKDEKGQFHKIKLRSGSIEKVLSSRKKRIRHLCKQEDLELERESDLIRLLELLENS
jgi:hypothetical protein